MKERAAAVTVRSNPNTWLRSGRHAARRRRARRPRNPDRRGASPQPPWALTAGGGAAVEGASSRATAGVEVLSSGWGHTRPRRRCCWSPPRQPEQARAAPPPPYAAVSQALARSSVAGVVGAVPTRPPDRARRRARPGRRAERRRGRPVLCRQCAWPPSSAVGGWPSSHRRAQRAPVAHASQDLRDRSSSCGYRAPRMARMRSVAVRSTPEPGRKALHVTLVLGPCGSPAVRNRAAWPQAPDTSVRSRTVCHGARSLAPRTRPVKRIRVPSFW